MFRSRRFLATAAVLGVVTGGTIVGISSPASAAESVRWLSLSPLPYNNTSVSRAVSGAGAPYTFMYYMVTTALPGRWYLGRAAFRPTSGCTYRGVTDWTGGSTIPSITPPSFSLTDEAPGQYSVSWSWTVALDDPGAAQVVVYVAGKCDDGTYELGNIQWYRWEDGTVGEGPIAPIGPLDPAAAQRIWNQGGMSVRAS